MTVREYPTKSAETWSLAPTVLSATTFDRPHALHKPTDHGEQQVQAKQPNSQSLHVSTSINCSKAVSPPGPLLDTQNLDYDSPSVDRRPG